MKCIPSLYTPAYPAAWLLFGMLFALAVAHFVAMPWPQLGTVAVYAVPLSWLSVLVWREQWHIQFVTALDVLFVGFILLLSASLAFQGGLVGETGNGARFLPFMVVAPYLCGRLMRVLDIVIFIRIILIAGVAMLPLLLLDRFISAGRVGGRWPFFGLDYGALLVGALLATALIALCARVLHGPNRDERSKRPNRFVQYGLIGLMTVFLVWVTARGWLLAGLAGVLVLGLSARQCSIRRRVGLLAAVLTIVGLSFWALPNFDSGFGRFYAGSTDMSSYAVPILSEARLIYREAKPVHSEAKPILGEAKPILGEASCQPLKEERNSIAIRWVLYREAIAMFAEKPAFGVGAARFGDRSCAGSASFPHSTILQVFAELGLVGGGVLAGLLAFGAATLVRPFLSAGQEVNRLARAFVLALFAAFLTADQIYGNYFMSTGMWLMLGIAASMRAHDRQEMMRG